MMFREYKIGRVSEDSEDWIFADTGDLVRVSWRNRPCGHCEMANTSDGHDGCLGVLPGVMNACCGHGEIDEAYIQFQSGTILRGGQARSFIACVKTVDEPVA